MTSLEMLECLSSNHSETFDELLEWPYRRVLKVFDAWQRRNAVDEIERRKNIHVGSLLGIVEWKEASDQNEAIEDVENYYEMLKDVIWNPKKMDEENQEMRDLESSDPFLAAGKRNLQKIVPAIMPGEEDITGLLE
jgi:hypothetical protein